jgi:hypothetical protein
MRLRLLVTCVEGCAFPGWKIVVVPLLRDMSSEARAFSAFPLIATTHLGLWEMGYEKEKKAFRTFPLIATTQLGWWELG